MSLKAKVIGIGAAGNKAAIQLIKDQVVPRSSVMLLNSTARDIPTEYKDDLAIEFGDVKGCGKERDIAKRMIVDALQSESIPMDKFIDGDEKMFIIVTSTEGGTGSGASVVIGEYLQEITGAPVHEFAFTGFEDDARGLKNTTDWFNDLNEKFVVEAISNKKCLDFVDGNRKAAEDYANKIFSKRVAILLGNYIVPSETNIDDTDLFKISTTPGFMTIESIGLDKIRDKDQFNSRVQDMIDNSVSLDTEESCKRIGVIINAGKKTASAIDDSFDVIKKKYGYPLEIFNHLQSVDEDEFIHIVISGMKFPLDEIKETYNKFKKQMERIDLEKDSFFGSNSRFDTTIGNSIDVGSYAKNPVSKDINKAKKAKASFFAKYGKSLDEPKEEVPKFTKTVKNEL